MSRVLSAGWIPGLAAAGLALACVASDHPVTDADLGRPTSSDAMAARLAVPGPVRFTRVVAADWVVDRAGLLNLDHPRARQAELESGDEPIQIYFYVLEHPRFGTYLVDSGVERGFRSDEPNPRVGPILRWAMGTERLEVRTTTRAWLETHRAHGGRLDGVFLTHLHLDHVMGLPDLPPRTPVYTGPGETGPRSPIHLFTRSTIDRMLASAGPLREWRFEPDPGGRFEGILDVFGDASVFALHVPGHTPGSTAFVVRSTRGPRLLVGDACHTRFGWEEGVEPGNFSLDGPRSAESLEQLRRFARMHSGLQVHLGHQSLPRRPTRTPGPG